MKTTLNLDDAVLSEARRLTGSEGKTALVHEGLRAFIALASARRLAAPGGRDPQAAAPPVAPASGHHGAPILVDTSVWIGHRRRDNARLVALLQEGQVRSHPCVVGELACGTLRQRTVVLALLGKLPASVCSGVGFSVKRGGWARTLAGHVRAGCP